ncbi:MAG: branched-chain amino acid transport system ATP-binding protein [Rhodobacteraceae bacterium HLUCCA12]|nr:MAG: branched-chain amino acid transport system ATP-binding protein [Rhodobacteraceae bacterium HLUCCA12]
MLLEVRDLHVFYDDFHVLHGVSLDVGEGELVGIVGANGHGKSTLLKAICGLTPVRSGTVRYRRERIDNIAAPDLVARGLVYVPEVRNLFNDMTVRENLLLGAYLQRDPNRTREILEQVFDLYPRLKERANQQAGTLSGGEAQMLALGRGMMSDARFMAIDEPSLGLAPALTESMLDTIAQINRSGVTVLIVEQSLSLIRDHVHRLYEIEEGKLFKLEPDTSEGAQAAPAGKDG